MTDFKNKVIEAIKLVPKGKVVSYGQVAAYAGSPRAAREVGWLLMTLDENTKLPWWRVVNNQGKVSIKGNKHITPEMQKSLLESEGIPVSDDFSFEIEKYRYWFR